MARVVCLLLISILAAPASAGPCAIRQLEASLLIQPQRAIPPGGGVIVGLTPFGFGGANGGGIEQKHWRFDDGGKLVAPVVRELAPGLAIYEPPTGTTTTTLRDGKRVLATVKRTPTATPALPAPDVRAVVHRVVKTRERYGEIGERRTVEVRLASKPADAEAVILYTHGEGPHAAVAWATIGQIGATPPGSTATELVVYHSPGRCESPMPFQETPTGSVVTVAWVDAMGRVSPRSKPITVRRARP